MHRLEEVRVSWSLLVLAVVDSVRHVGEDGRVLVESQAPCLAPVRYRVRVHVMALVQTQLQSLMPPLRHDARLLIDQRCFQRPRFGHWRRVVEAAARDAIADRWEASYVT